MPRRLKKRLRRAAKRGRRSRRVGGRARNATMGFKIPAQILKYISRGAYGQETKTLDGAFVVNTTTAVVAYVSDRYLAAANQTAPPQTADDSYFTSIPICNTGALQAINLVAQGAGVSQRIGNKISMKSLRLRLTAYASDINAFSPTALRVMLIYDRQPSGAATYPPIYSILTYQTQLNAEITGDMYASVSVNNLERYTVIMDKLLTQQPIQNNGEDTNLNNLTCVGVTEAKSYVIDEYIPLKDLETVFKSSSDPPDIGDIITGSCFLLVAGDAPAAMPGWCLKGSYRLRFHDN